jgi:double-stranded uracil-DNA glycosylase
VALVRSFAPIARRDARLLILGSMPGTASLRARRYYAHPANAFWPILAAACEFERTAPYARRTAALRANGIAVWDVLAACERDGSLDSDIAPASMQPNDFATFFARHPHIATVLLNGGTAFRLFTKRVVPSLADAWRGLQCLQMPSTSPANAGTPFVAKQAVWGAPLQRHLASRRNAAPAASATTASRGIAAASPP